MRMKRNWILAAVVVIVALLLAGCGNQIKADLSAKAPGPADYKAANSPQTAELGNNLRIIREEKESQVFMIMDAKNGETGYIVKIFDDEKKVIYEAKVPKVNNYEPWTKMVDDNIVQIRQSRGSGFWVCFYYDRANNRVSPKYHNPLLAGNGKVVFPIGGKPGSNKILAGLAVSDIFDKNVYYKELIIEDLPPSLNAFEELKWIGVDKLSITYLTGETRDQSKEKTIIFNLLE